MLETYNVLDKMVLAGKLSPGVVTLTGHDRDRNWDVKQSKNSDGGTSSLNGAPVGTFTASYYLVQDSASGVDEIAEWDEWQKLCDRLAPNASGMPPQRASVYHPDLARQYFTQVSVKKIYGLVHDGKGGAIGKVDFIEFRPPKPKKPHTAKEGATQPDQLAGWREIRAARRIEAAKPL